MPNIAVRKRTVKEIYECADSIRHLQKGKKFNVLKALDMIGVIFGVEYQIVEEKSKYLEYNEFAKFDIAKNKIFIRERVYNNAEKGILQDEYTIAHEIGHAMLHREIALYRSSKQITQSRDPEYQADKFAARLLRCKEQKKIIELFGIRFN